MAPSTVATEAIASVVVEAVLEGFILSEGDSTRRDAVSWTGSGWGRKTERRRFPPGEAEGAGSKTGPCYFTGGSTVFLLTTWIRNRHTKRQSSPCTAME